MVTVQPGYCFSTPALSLSARCASDVRSLLSYSKNAGLSGEFLFKSSSDAAEIASSRTGSGGTIVGSATGSGGAGGWFGAVLGGGGGIGRVTGAVFLPQAAALSASTAKTHTRDRAAFIVSSPVIWTNPASRCCRSS